ncbi:hsp90 co-chaperone Cdc37-like 1 isoform X2 [Rissa tridactyla]|uniref:hsp90 co-chaperone Cdc37-like 1 isoform X2 n=1 Tax=Rissa tridactyla TaxID=75485 RepID=UPI0023BACBE4|nr:hsp90 co-chaperone Cdc37-like 1 isoform X2 [Rissa tridactyla]
MALWLPRSRDGDPPSEEDEERGRAPASSRRLQEVQTYSQGIELACQKEREFVKHSVECTWNLAEAQQKLGSLALHNSESCNQESAKAKTEAAELRWREEEWRRKEEALNQRERHNLWNTDLVSKEVFNKSFINQKRKEVEDEDVSEPRMQKHEQKIRHFGMLSRWDDSQRFLSDHPYLVCEETSRYLMLWCYHLEAEQKRALMEQVAHQAVAMQFIIEIARSCNVDPRGCFRLFFQKAKRTYALPQLAISSADHSGAQQCPFLITETGQSRAMQEKCGRLKLWFAVDYSVNQDSDGSQYFLKEFSLNRRRLF